MIGNPLNPPDPVLVNKIATIGIGPGKVPSRDENVTIKAALQTGITEGQKLINQKTANLGQELYGWSADPQNGAYATDYLLRAAVTQAGLGANIAQEFFSPVALKDNQRNPLSGNNNYTIHFNPAPPVFLDSSVARINDYGWEVSKFHLHFMNHLDTSIMLGDEMPVINRDTKASANKSRARTI